MNNYDNIIIKELLSDLKGNELKSIYSFHEKYRIGPCDLARAINYLIDNNIIELSDNRVKLLTINDDNVLLSLKYFFLNDNPNLMKSDSDQYKEHIEINKPYMPNQNLLDSSYFVIGNK